MNPPEFRRWFEQTHCSYFPGMEAWLAKMTDDRAKGVLEKMEDTLRPVAIEDAEKASRRMSEADHVDRVYERHAATIRRLASEFSNGRGCNRPRAGMCNFCGGDGLAIVRVFGPYFTAHFERYGAEQADRATMTVICTCAAGETIQHRLRGPKPPILNLQEMQLATAPGPKVNAVELMERVLGLPFLSPMAKDVLMKRLAEEGRGTQ